MKLFFQVRNMRHLFLAAFLFATPSCDTSEPPSGGEPSVQFAAVDASCTEVWLQVKILPGVPQRTIRIQRDSTVILNTTLTATETLVVDEGLLPNSQYNYNLSTQTESGEERVDSRTRTLDTTSHNFTWEIDTLGISGSILYDVFIINDTLVYAAGEMYLRDSIGEVDPNAYNLAGWNGNTFELLRVQFLTFCNQAGTGPYPTRSVFAFDEHDVRVTSGSQLVSWTGDSQTPPACIPVSVSRLWGETSGSVYAVGVGGKIAYFNGLNWGNVSSGTTADMRDVSGYSPSGRKIILSLAFSPGETRILSLSPQSARDTLGWPIGQRLRGIWTSNGLTVYVSGPGIWRNTGSSWRQMSGAPQNQFLTGIRGTSENNFFAIAWQGVLSHFNGVSWHQYAEIPPNYNFEAIAVSNNLVVAVGFTGGLSADKAAVVIGRRNP